MDVVWKDEVRVVYMERKWVKLKIVVISDCDGGLGVKRFWLSVRKEYCGERERWCDGGYFFLDMCSIVGGKLI